jgi:hypothetical protein
VRAQVAGRLAHREEPRRLMLRRGLRGPRGAWVGLAVQKAWKNLTIRELAAIAGASLRMSASSANLLAEKETAELLGLLPSYRKVNQRSLAIGSRSTCLLRISQPSTDAYRPNRVSTESAPSTLETRIGDNARIELIDTLWKIEGSNLSFTS